MSQQFFHVKEHVFDGQHIREYPRATAKSQEDVLRVAVKQYIPRSNPDPQPGDVTIIAGHANGLVKELYEPMWDDLLAASARHGFRIRSIWIADAAWQGQSWLLNQDVVGNDPSWFDHSRDILHMVNVFRRDMPRPLVGIGHSFGAIVIAQAALWHPRLFSSLVLLDPVLASYSRTVTSEAGLTPLDASAVRRETWPSRAAAAAAFKRSRTFAVWDPRVLDAWVAHGLTPLPTKFFPASTENAADPADPPVTLTTPKHQEVFTFMRPLLQGVDIASGRRVFDRQRVRDISDASLANTDADDTSTTSPDDAADPSARTARASNLYRPEVPATASQLPALRPGVCFVFGDESPVAPPEMRDRILRTAGTGVGGSGGVTEGRARAAVLPQTGHLVAMERPRACAEYAAAWLGEDLRHERAEAAELAAAWWPRSDRLKQTIDGEWEALFVKKAPKSRL